MLFNILKTLMIILVLCKIIDAEDMSFSDTLSDAETTFSTPSRMPREAGVDGVIIGYIKSSKRTNSFADDSLDFTLMAYKGDFIKRLTGKLDTIWVKLWKTSRNISITTSSIDEVDTTSIDSCLAFNFPLSKGKDADSLVANFSGSSLIKFGITGTEATKKAAVHIRANVLYNTEK